MEVVTRRVFWSSIARICREQSQAASPLQCASSSVCSNTGRELQTHSATTRPPLQVTFAQGAAPHGAVPVQEGNAAFVTALFSASSPAAAGSTTRDFYSSKKDVTCPCATSANTT